MVLRTSARPDDAVLHRDVGALQLLRDASAPDALHGRVGRQGRPWVRRSIRGSDLRSVHLDGVHGDAARRLGRGPADRPTPGGPLWRHPDRERPLQHGIPHARDVLSRPLPHRHRHRPSQGEHQRPRRHALRGRRQTPRRRFLHLLHGDQPGRVHRAPDLRIPGRKHQLALRVRGRRRRYGGRLDSVRVGRQVPGPGRPRVRRSPLPRKRRRTGA